MSDRFEKFTERAKKALTLAQQEAVRFNHNYIGTEHLLLGVVAEGQGVGARMLTSFGVDLPRLRESLTFIVGRGNKPVEGDISLTPRAKLVVDHAIVEAQRLRHNYVGTEHLLLGVANPGIDGISVRMLEACGVDLEALRKATLSYLAGETERLLGGGESDAPAGTPPAIGTRPRDNVVTCRVDDQTLGALDALVETGVHTTRSEAAARLIVGGIQANQALFKRVYEAVAEIRRVREETQTLVRLWDRGTAEERGSAAEEGQAPDAPKSVAAQGNPEAPQVANEAPAANKTKPANQRRSRSDQPPSAE